MVSSSSRLSSNSCGSAVMPESFSSSFRVRVSLGCIRCLMAPIMMRTAAEDLSSNASADTTLMPSRSRYVAIVIASLLPLSNMAISFSFAPFDVSVVIISSVRSSMLSSCSLGIRSMCTSPFFSLFSGVSCSTSSYALRSSSAILCHLPSTSFTTISDILFIKWLLNNTTFFDER